MKNALFILTALFTALLFSCGKSAEQKFVGTWQNIKPFTSWGTKDTAISKLIIKKDGDVYLVKYNWFSGGFSPADETWSRDNTYKLEGGSLKQTGQFITSSVEYLESSGHLKFENGSLPSNEWKKISDNTQ